jgi:hypothetical protein
MTAVVVLPPGVFAQGRRPVTEQAPAAIGWGPPRQEQVVPRQPEAVAQQQPPRWDWTRWWAPEPHELERLDDARRGGVQLTPAAGIPVQGTPAGGIPARGVAANGTPANGLPVNGFPASGVPASGVPASGVPVNGLPASGVPVNGAPGNGVPADGGPANGTVVAADGVLDGLPDAAPGDPTTQAETVTVWVTDADPPAAHQNGAAGDHGDGDGGDAEPGEPPDETATPTRIRLNQRRPQAHLAPELRRGPDGGSQAAPVTRPDAVKARDALSRYQANRRAALAKNVTEEGPARER